MSVKYDILSSVDAYSSLTAVFPIRTAKLSHDSSAHQEAVAAVAWAAHHEVVSVVEDMEVTPTAAAAVAVNSTSPMFVSQSKYPLSWEVIVNIAL